MFQNENNDDTRETDVLLNTNGDQDGRRVSFGYQGSERAEEAEHHRDSRFQWLNSRSSSDYTNAASNARRRRIILRPSQEDISEWATESATPMTSTPHFVVYRNLPAFPKKRTSSFNDRLSKHQSKAEIDSSVHAALVRCRRSRSRSLGSSSSVDLPLVVPNIIEKQPPGSAESNVFLKPTQDGAQQQDTVSPSITQASEESTTTTTTTTTQSTPFLICVMYGLINATIVLPIIISFTSIIYRDRAFADYMPLLVKLTVFSGAVHQVCFSAFSSLPFCVGSVQDAGLIFLSSMASDIVDYCRQHGHGDDVLLATATIGLPLCAALLGVSLMVIGRLKLAQYVQMLPTCVVGGYLAYIGWFCGMAGIGLMIPTTSPASTKDDDSSSSAESSSSSSSGTISLAVILEDWEFVAPGIVGGILLYAAVRRLKHMAVLPCSIALLLVIFYSVLFFRGASIEEVTEQGWIRSSNDNSGDDDTTTPDSIWQTWSYLKFDLVAWKALPRLIWTEIAMIFVVALSSSLDVAAIELEMGRELDYNRELKTVGLSNIISGCTGGYTGSYIFSQSIFSLRAGIRSRAAGFVLAGAQLLFLILPFDLLAYVPNFFFGSLLVMICVDLVYEWLWDVRNKVTPIEYSICLATFAIIQVAQVEGGILLGVALYLICRQAQLICADREAGKQDKTDSITEEKFIHDASEQQQLSNGKSYGSTSKPV